MYDLRNPHLAGGLAAWAEGSRAGTIVLVTYHDPEGKARAHAHGPADALDAVRAAAQRHLKAYKEAKAEERDPLADATFTERVTYLEEG